MAVVIDEVTADVAPPETRGQSEQASGSPAPSSPQQERKLREQVERMQLRAKRVCAN
jgi:hypothetical protein